MDDILLTFLPKNNLTFPVQRIQQPQPVQHQQIPVVQYQPPLQQMPYQNDYMQAPPAQPIVQPPIAGNSILAPGALYFLATGKVAPPELLSGQQKTIVKQEGAAEEKKQWIPTPADVRFFPIYVTERGLTIYAVIMTRHPPSWSEFFQYSDKEIRHACQKIDEDSAKSGKAIYPHPSNVLAAFWLTPLFLLKCVIIGQDPYPGHNRNGMPKAIGACFASDRESGEIPDSLITIYKELERTVEDWKHPGHPDIRCWGRQGVLLLNAALTVEAGNPKSHFGYWKPFTEKLMSYLNDHCTDLVFLLWGKVAQKAADTIYGSKHQKLNAYHPSSMNAGKEEYQFGGCNHFNLANEFLVSKGIHPIDWRIR